MKRFLTVLVGLSIFSVTMTSCGFNYVVPGSVKSLSISGTKDNFVVGDSYLDYSDLTIKVTFGDQRVETLTLDDVTFTIKLGTKTYDIHSPFEEAGSYKMYATYKNVKSNTLTITVYDTDIYVSSMTAEGEHSLGTGGVANIALTVNPENFTVQITAQSSDENILTVSKVDELNFKVKAISTGEASVTFTALSGESTYISISHDITVQAYSKVNIDQTYNDFIKNNAYTLSSCPLEGEPKLLVIPVWFTDSSTYIKSSTNKETVRNDIRKAYFGSSSDTGWHSVSTYYQQESNGKLNLNGTVSEWYTSNISTTEAAYYTSRQTANFVKKAVNWYFDNHSSDNRKNYDYDGDGYLDGVMLIYGAPDNSALGTGDNNLWAYCFWVQEISQKNPYNPGCNVFFWASYDFMYGESVAKSHAGSKYNSGDTSHCSIDAHTYIHEMGHVFGLEDYYDYGGNYVPAGAFSMQDYNVGAHDPFSVMALGWANPYIPQDTCTITIEDFQSSHDLILLTPNWNDYNCPFDEYLLLELFTPTGLNEFDCVHQYQSAYPQGPNSTGIRVWHVDARLMRGYTFPAASNVNIGSVLTGLNNNSVYDSDRGCHAGEAYQSYNLLQLIRNSTSETYNSKSELSAANLFRANNSFAMKSFNKQFVRGNLLDSGKSLGWSLKVDSIDTVSGVKSATITVTKI